MMRERRQLFLGLTAAVMLVGCIGGASDGESTVTTADVGSTSSSLGTAGLGFPMIYEGPPVTFGTPVWGGTLVLDVGQQCAAVAATSGEVWVLAVPEGSTIEVSGAEEPALIMDGCIPLHHGEYVEFGGGRAGSEYILDPSFLERCGATMELPWLVGSCVGESRD